MEREGPTKMEREGPVLQPRGAGASSSRASREAILKSRGAERDVGRQGDLARRTGETVHHRAGDPDVHHGRDERRQETLIAVVRRSHDTARRVGCCSEVQYMMRNACTRSLNRFLTLAAVIVASTAAAAAQTPPPAGAGQRGGGRGPGTPPLLMTTTAWEDGGVI